MSAQRFEGCIGFGRLDDLHQLDFLELVLTDHAACVATRRASLRAKARCMCSEFQRQQFRRDDLLAHQIRQRNLRGRYQVEALLAFERE